MQPTHVVGVGSFASKRARMALAGLEVAVGTILHPSPASPLANRGWAAAASRQLAALGIEYLGSLADKRMQAIGKLTLL
jgi:single-strand selective monofunctional uracil DNA glycosylase